MQADIPGSPSPITPQPTPTPSPASTTNSSTLSTILILVAIVAAVWYFGFRQNEPPKPPAPSPSTYEAVGRDYARRLTAAYADAVDASLPSFEGGGKVADFQAAFAKEWAAKRGQAFQSAVVPTLSGIIPEGTEPDPKTAEGASARARFSAAWRGISSGMRAGQ